MECSIELSMYNRLYHRHGGHRRQAQGCKVSMCVVLCLAAGKVEIRVWEAEAAALARTSKGPSLVRENIRYVQRWFTHH